MTKRKPEPWRNRIVGYADVAASDLSANPLNARLHPAAQRAALTAVLDDVGFVAPVIVNKRTGLIVDGHLRVEEASARGEAVPVAYVELTEAEEREVLATLDPIGAMATYDAALLGELLEGVDTSSDELRSMLDAVAKQAGLVEQFDGIGLDDDVPELPEAPVSTTGDIWILRSSCGTEHRLMCGDSSSQGDVERLMTGIVADAMVTDPPYGVDYGASVEWRAKMGAHARNRNQTNTHILGDGAHEAEGLWQRTFPLWRQVLRQKGSCFYRWSASGDLQFKLANALDAAGLAIHGSVVWVKDSFSFSRSEHKYQHEPAWYGWRSDGTHSWHGPTNESSVWECARPARSDSHPTMKPVPLIARCIRNITSEGAVVVDPFMGSGTLLVAAEEMNRRAIGMELDPRYVDVAVRRWSTLTGLTAFHAETGEPFRLARVGE